MNDRGKSDSRVVPAKLANKTGQPAAELVEERRLTKGNTDQHNASRTQSRDVDASSALGRVRRVAQQDRETRFTALLHHVTLDRLRTAYWALNPRAAAGADGVTWGAYGQDLEAHLQDLHGRVHRGAYRARPSRRVYIPKVDGILDADIRGFYDAIDHGWMRRFVEHRIADKRVLRLIQKWLDAGVIEDGAWSASEEGAPQGATISPLLANLYLHHVFDLWARQWRRRQAHGDVVIVRLSLIHISEPTRLGMIS